MKNKMCKFVMKACTCTLTIKPSGGNVVSSGKLSGFWRPVHTKTKPSFSSICKVLISGNAQLSLCSITNVWNKDREYQKHFLGPSLKAEGDILLSNEAFLLSQDCNMALLPKGYETVSGTVA